MNCPKCSSPGVKGHVQYTEPLTQGWTCACGEQWSGPYSEPESFYAPYVPLQISRFVWKDGKAEAIHVSANGFEGMKKDEEKP